MSIKGKYPESTPLYAALLSAGAVAAVIVFFIVYSVFSDGETKKPEVSATQTSASTEAPEDDSFHPDEALAEEMKDEAERLIKQNYEVLTLYYTHGLPHLDEPYGNVPEDGYYTVDSTDYTSLEQLEKLVDSTYTKSQAKTVKQNSLGYGPIYITRANGDLGIIANFTEMPYDRSWDDPTFSITPVSEKECEITLTLHKRDSDEVETVTGTMSKSSKNGWRLKQVLF